LSRAVAYAARQFHSSASTQDKHGWSQGEPTAR